MSSLSIRSGLICTAAISAAVMTAFWQAVDGNGAYLLHPTAVPNGGDMYSHVDEALFVYHKLKHYHHQHQQPEHDAFASAAAQGGFGWWFPYVSTGYPMFLAYQPLPIVFVAGMMYLLDGVMPPMAVFRCCFAGLWTLVPWAWFVGARWLGLLPLESSVLAALSIGLASWRAFGLEFTSISAYGLYTQVYAAVLLPLVVGALFRLICASSLPIPLATRASQGVPTEPARPAAWSPSRWWPSSPLLAFEAPKPISPAMTVVCFTLTCLCHVFFGMFAGIASLTLVLAACLVNLAESQHRTLTTFRAALLARVVPLAQVYAIALALLLWWLVPMVLKMPYVGGLPWKGESENGYPISTLIDKFWSGQMLDYNTPVPVITYASVAGVVVLSIETVQAVRSVLNLKLATSAQTASKLQLGLFLLFQLAITWVLFTGRTTLGWLFTLLPFHAELEVIRYLSGIQYLCAVLAAVSIAAGIRLVSQCLVATFSWILSLGRKTQRTGGDPTATQRTASFRATHAILPLVLFALVAIPFVGLRREALLRELTLEYPDSTLLNETCELVRQVAPNGRMLLHKRLGTDQTFMYNHFPFHCDIPGLFTYSRGYHDSLSVYPIEYLQPTPDDMRLYNIRALVARTYAKDGADLFALLAGMDELPESNQAFHVYAPRASYGHFESVRTGGYVAGDFKAARPLIVNSIVPMFKHGVVLEFARTSAVVQQVPARSSGASSPRTKPDDVLAAIGADVAFPLQEQRLLAERPFLAANASFWTVLSAAAEGHGSTDGLLHPFVADLSEFYSQHPPDGMRVLDEHVHLLDATYAAIVEVTSAAVRPVSSLFPPDHVRLMLKVTFHPYWSCRLVATQLDAFSSSTRIAELLPTDAWLHVPVKHTTPNMMAVDVPAGRYLVVFQYENPAFQQALAILALCLALLGLPAWMMLIWIGHRRSDVLTKKIQ
ncbi:hypothetical protein CAOG_03847 [Capsaspora owczarzaki ATCC 30864]|uniref:Uncharacterized protein n=1 Tax=Capsaspora owczarzaki (strain ATCC 30864) TaxID=595528 RepID=A0A0D2X2Q7_CAPO3|nr:hypothetical protein CAOG_03847 [Capsaspora owczarzaki ATCC 30864]KJE92979.1 hypothetical protein CAOG_003847 [Capsaspora owczarzaki ATCC 30864]|eukprot:XP_004363575.1 hypothetical protein CAOG_03847 [Capsaspora owczarzaki ATCC 30864]